MPITQQVELIDKKEFARAALDENFDAFVVHMVFFTSKMIIDLAQKAQIALLLGKKVTVLEKYSDFTNVFSKKLVEVLPECMRINKHAIELQEDKQLSYGPIYSLGLVKLETLKTFIKTNLANNFI